MWLAAAAEDSEGGHASLPSSESILSRVVIALDPSGFTCKAFHDLTVRTASFFLFCMTGAFRRGVVCAHWLSLPVCAGATLSLFLFFARGFIHRGEACATGLTSSRVHKYGGLVQHALALAT